MLSTSALPGCGGDNNGTSPASLTGELLPASEVPGFKVEREFEWDNPIDFVVEGFHLPEATPPSDAVEAFENAGFDAAAGEILVVAKGEPFQGPRAAVDVVQLGSDDQAREALDYVRSEALKQPCFAVCSVEGREFPVAGIPGAEGVQLTPLPDPPPGAGPPFESFSVGFTDGSRLYLVSADGGPGQVKKGEVLSAAEALYDRATSDAG
ncbi:MAG: hypothetical protein AABM66_14815 [Actinomycetota bacterium]